MRKSHSTHVNIYVIDQASTVKKKMFFPLKRKVNSSCNEKICSDSVHPDSFSILKSHSGRILLSSLPTISSVL